MVIILAYFRMVQINPPVYGIYATREIVAYFVWMIKISCNISAPRLHDFN
jgi:hypothetical protein